MSDEKKSFGELLNDAPLASGENTTSLVGALARSLHPEKFVLMLSGNQSVTLDVDAVKGYRVLSGMIGQLIVEVEIDRERVPESIRRTQPGSLPFLQSYFTNPHTDPNPALTTPTFDQPWLGYSNPTFDRPVFTFPSIDNSPVKNIFEPIPDPTVYNQGDPWQFGGYPAAGVAPFALATPHQAPPAVIAAMQMNVPFGGPNSSPAVAEHTSILLDVMSIPSIDKPIWQDPPVTSATQDNPHSNPVFENISTPGFPRIYD
jgi:hypothetical protein